ncbi:6-hydroxymethylpterin diphosphokinase MptE-like protein [Hwanghaeella sp.]|uniref:motility associated factor glycosyltransferase family protein n=1 Tax=Hwanghaeella sp. TaxID=2605943 RepID=UPI003CCB84FF
MAATQEKSLFLANLDTLKAAGLSGPATAVLRIGEPVMTRTSAEEPGGPNLLQGGAPLYTPDAAQAAFAQVESYLKRPVRHLSTFTGVPEKTELLSHEAIRKVLGGMQGQSLNPTPDPETGYLVCFGLGLGLHLPLLQQALPFRTLVVVEENPEFLLHSLHTVDWTALDAACKARGGRLHLILSKDAQSVADTLLREMRGPEFPMIDGSYIYQHYTSPFLDKSIDALREAMPIIEANDGFFEDEQIMLDQACRNFLRNDFFLLTEAPTPRPLKPMPVFVVGSGPSLDRNIEDIRRNRENVILMSCGTSLRPLLEAGMVPDFHSEIENVEDIGTIIGMLSREHDLSGIPLIAANTVKQSVLDKFDRKILYWRDTVVPTRLLASQEDTLSMTGPTVTNLAIRAAISMGFYEFYLFGIDLGSPDPDRHHAKASVYNATDDEYWKSGAAMEPFVIEQPGNMGGTIYTNRPFLLTKFFFETLFSRFPNHHFFNCSHGVRFEHATPIVSSTLEAMPAEIPGPELVDKCLGELTDVKAGGLVPVERLEEYRSALVERFDNLGALCERASETDFDTLLAEIRSMIAPVSYRTEYSTKSAVDTLISGTITTILHFGYFMVRRIPKDDRPRFMSLFTEALHDAVGAMRVRALALTDELIEERRAQ